MRVVAWYVCDMCVVGVCMCIYVYGRCWVGRGVGCVCVGVVWGVGGWGGVCCVCVRELGVW